MSRAIFSLILALCLRMPFGDTLGAADTEKVYIYLKPQACVAGWQVLLSDVAEIEGFNEGLIALLSEMSLGPAPAHGEMGTLERSEIRRRLVLNRIDPIKVALVGAEQTTLTRNGRVVEKEELEALVEDYITRSWAGEQARTETTYSRMPGNLNLSDADLELKIVDPVRPRVSGSFSLSVAAFDEGRLVQRLPVSLNLRAFEKVAVLKKSLGNSYLLSPDDVELVEQETSACRSTPVKSIVELAGKRLKRRMKAGQILTADCLESPPLIERGDEITLIVHYKNITVGCPGKAWQNGRLGEKILVRNQYGKNLMGAVQDAHTVLITQ